MDILQHFVISYTSKIIFDLLVTFGTYCGILSNFWFCKLFFFKNHCAKTKYSKKCGQHHAPAHFFKVYLKKKFRALSQKLKKWELRTRARDIKFFFKIFFSKNHCAETKYSTKCGQHHAPAHFFKVYLKKKFRDLSQKLKKWELRTRARDIKLQNENLT